MCKKLCEYFQWLCNDTTLNYWHFFFLYTTLFHARTHNTSFFTLLFIIFLFSVHIYIYCYLIYTRIKIPYQHYYFLLVAIASYTHPLKYSLTCKTCSYTYAGSEARTQIHMINKIHLYFNANIRKKKIRVRVSILYI